LKSALVATPLTNPNPRAKAMTSAVLRRPKLGQLDEITRRINRRIDKAQGFGRRSVGAWYDVGLDLTEAKAEAPSFSGWLKSAVPRLALSRAKELVSLVDKTDGKRALVSRFASLEEALRQFKIRRGFGDGPQDWRTPPELFDQLHSVLRFQIDACADDGNALLPTYWTEAIDAKKQQWQGKRIWCNPPFNSIGDFLPLATKAEVATVVMFCNALVSPIFTESPPKFLLVPPRRIQFVPPAGHESNRPNQGSVLGIYGKVTADQIRRLETVGTVFKAT
jgi:phage N-6-adenine-methyltransferase